MSGKVKVLWVEDEFGTIKGTVRSARRKNFDVHIAETTEDAVRLLKRDKFDLLIVDFRIPAEPKQPPIKGEGLRLIKRILDNCVDREKLQKRILLLTAQSATYRKDSDFEVSTWFDVMEKPGSHLKVISWMERMGSRVE